MRSYTGRSPIIAWSIEPQNKNATKSTCSYAVMHIIGNEIMVCTKIDNHAVDSLHVSLLNILLMSLLKTFRSSLAVSIITRSANR